ncbi:MAG: CPBP family intramembrane metalloprotease [Candidatus Obscuribacterales bacterium]|nr:CPBP family intramembrane metalloprotease [Candidatus Obscuribacterales bacterium]
MLATYKRSHVLNIVLIVEAVLLFVATIWCQLAHIDLMPLLKLDSWPRDLGYGCLIGLSMSTVSLLISLTAKALSSRFSFLNFFTDFVSKTLSPMFAEVNLSDILLIALVSGFCEEVLFRGVVQQQWGLIWASVIFGLFHYTGNRYLFYVFWAGAAGILLGLCVEHFHSLWVPVIAHVFNNFMSIVLIRYRVGYRND